MSTARIEIGDCLDVLRTLESESVHCCVTSPPYFGLRDYGHAGQIGLEPTPEAYVARLVDVFREVRRVLRDDGTLWLNLASSYAYGGTPPIQSHADAWLNNPIFRQQFKPKDMIPIPWMVAMALQADGWYLRSDIIWSKPNPMPESVTDRPTKAHEYLFLLSKSARYYYDAEAIAEPYAPDSFARYQYAFGGAKSEALIEANKDGIGQRTRVVGMRPYNGQATKDYDAANAQNPSDTKRRVLESMKDGQGRNKRTVWTVPTAPYAEAHFATFPPDLIRPCIRAGCPLGGIMLDCFAGSGTSGAVALEEGRSAILIELNPDYRPLIESRCAVTPSML